MNRRRKTVKAFFFSKKPTTKLVGRLVSWPDFEGYRSLREWMDAHPNAPRTTFDGVLKLLKK